MTWIGLAIPNPSSITHWLTSIWRCIAMANSSILHSDLVVRLSSALALTQFPHKDWSLLTNEEKGFYVQDVIEFLAACRLANIELRYEVPGV